MKKLLTTGCSYTSYYYPTWADWLGVYFDKHINLGVSGSGPRYSYTALNDFFRYKKNNPKDYIVIVQWSSLLRHDKRNPETGHWYWGGQIDNNINYNEDYLKKFYNSIDNASDLVNYIEHLILLSEKLGFKLLMTYMFEPWIDSYLGEPVFAKDICKQNILEFKKSNYIKSLKDYSKSEYWINPSIESFTLKTPIKNKILLDYLYLDEWKQIEEHHPSPYQHLMYAKLIGKQIYQRLDNSVPLEKRITYADNYDSIALELDKYLSIDGNSSLMQKKGLKNSWKYTVKLENILNYL